MAAVTQLGYLGIGVKDIEAWKDYSEGLLGLNVASRESDGSLLLRMDDHHHRFEVLPDERDDIAYIGWQTDSGAELEAIAARLEGSGIRVDHGSRETTEKRHVTGLIQFQDPDGYSVEVFHGPEMAVGEFTASKPGTGFVAGDEGLGHLVLTVDSLPRAMTFYQEMLGMKVSDYVNGPLTLGFLHCNPRHHSIAFAEMKNSRKRINHFMLQLDSIDAVGRTYDTVQEGSAPLLVSMGRHSNDEMVSFYMANPSMFGVEYGWGARSVDDCTWEVAQYDSGSLWGHKPVRRSQPVPQT